MICLQLNRAGVRGRQVIKQVWKVTTAYNPNFHHVNTYSSLNQRILQSNLQSVPRNSTSNSCTGCESRYFRMDERLRRIRNPTNNICDVGQKSNEVLPQTGIRPQSTKSKSKSARRKILRHLSKSSKLVPLETVGKVEAIENFANKCASNVKLAPHCADTSKVYFQELVGTAPRNTSERDDTSEQPLQLSTVFNSLDQPCDNRLNFDSAPKSILHNYLEKVANRFNSHSYLLNQPDFIETKNGIWSCIYGLLWPWPVNFMGQGFSKRDASHNAAKEALTWLKLHKYMDDFGTPIFNKLEQKSATIFPNQLSCANAIAKPIQVRSYSTSSRVDINSNTSDQQISPQINLEKIKVAPNVNSPEEATPQTEEHHATHVRKLYPAPKSALHNYFITVGNELKRKDLFMVPHYTKVKQKTKMVWTCSYSLKWPELMKFSATAQTKQDASYKAAVAALSWLMQKSKISKEGKPIIYDKKEVIKIRQKECPIIAFDKFVEGKINKIVNVYKNDLVRQLVKDLDATSGLGKGTVEELDEKWPQPEKNRFKQKYMGLDFYKAQEPVKLPISDYREEIIAQLENSRVLIVKGEPGCGKSTRVPQYVLEGWARGGGGNGQPCRIIVTQPRRIAAISLAERVSSERQENVGQTVGYQVRLKSNFNQQTGCIMYCTTGILLRRLQSDPKLLDCSHIILDEAHERDVNTDLLMNLVRHALDLNPNLKVLVMSATMDAKVFQDYFSDAPVLHIPGFTYPVKEYFLNEEKLPKTHQMCMGQNPNVVHEEVVKQIGNIHRTKPEGAILCFLPGWDDILKIRNLIPNRPDVSVLCLHSRLQVSEQQRIFGRPPMGVRKIILATNIAETSITIDDVVYVIDTGIHKEERFDVEKGVNCIDNHWISQASAKQRKGRAGRCRAGECFRLYPESKHAQFLEYSIPEILRTSLTKIVLDSKVYSNNMDAVEFLEQLVCPPEVSAVKKAVDELKELELLDEEENLTPLGRTVSTFQLPPKLSKAMVNAVIFKCVTPIIDIATIFSADTALFTKSLNGQLEVKKQKSKFSRTSDHLSLMRMLELWLEYTDNNDSYAAQTFCDDTGLVQHKLFTLQKLRNIHFDYLHRGLNRALPIADDFSDNDELVKAVLLSGVGNVLQHRTWDIVKGLLKKTNVLITRNKLKATITSESVNTRRGTFPTDFLLYINETISNLRHTTLVRETSFISPLTVLLFKNGELEIEELPKDNYSEKLKSDDQIILKLKGTKMEFFCDRKQAESIKECKEVLRACVQYYIYQLTKGGESNDTINFHWNEILRSLDDMFTSLNVERLDRSRLRERY